MQRSLDVLIHGLGFRPVVAMLGPWVNCPNKAALTGPSATFILKIAKLDGTSDHEIVD
ncbi:hypothetical protein [Roseobacter sp. HKCCA0882]|uniref:hypothetical protein n=1 Tax=Roseobacter sp. HKCCA0882 TaxID=3120337 RepID=UPI0030EBAD49